MSWLVLIVVHGLLCALQWRAIAARPSVFRIASISLATSIAMAACFQLVVSIRLGHTDPLLPVAATVQAIIGLLTGLLIGVIRRCQR